MIEAMLTTVDNPYDPFEEFTPWFAFDTRQGYNSSGLLARIVVNSNELSEADQAMAVERAIDEIVEFNLSGMHKKVTREVPDP